MHAQPQTLPNPRTVVRVMIVDDSVVARATLRDAIARVEGIEVAGVANNGAVAIEKLSQIRVDVVILDVEMPVMDGLQTLDVLREKSPNLPVVMFGAGTQAEARVTVEALCRGATDCVPKPAGMASRAEAVAYVQQELTPRLLELGATEMRGKRPRSWSERRRDRTRARTGELSESSTALRLRESGAMLAPRSKVIGIGSSTGGPNALLTLLAAWPHPPRVPVLICQHMPSTFTELLATRIGVRTGFDAAEACHGEVLRPGTIRVAPGGQHLRVASGPQGPQVMLEDGPLIHGCRPAVDIMFASLAETYREAVTGVVLTGMGVDGADGAQHIRDGGGQVLVQDEASSVVWGMPGAVARRGLAHRVLGLDILGGAIRTTVAG